jgi:hypothetical protein
VARPDAPGHRSAQSTWFAVRRRHRAASIIQDLLRARLADRADVPADNVHPRLQKPVHLKRVIDLQNQEAGTATDEVVPAAQVPAERGDRVLLGEQTLSYLLIAGARLPRETAIP